MTAIQELLPEARFIHLIRDGRDVALSLRELTWFGPGPDFVDQAGHWAARVRIARQQAQVLPYYLKVRYEDLVRDPPTVLRRICDFIELPYDPVMKDPSSRAAERLGEFGDRQYAGRKAWVPRERLLRSHSSTLLPPHPGRIGRWRTGMSATERRTFESGRANRLDKEVKRLRRELARNQALLDAIAATRTWRLRSRLRRLLGFD